MPSKPLYVTYRASALTRPLELLCFKIDQTNGGADRNRTDDPLLAKQVLSQLSYSPFKLNSV